jgi:NADH-quinone oxidoreductase subunit J
MTLSAGLFYLLAGLALLSASQVVLRKNPLHASLGLISTLVVLALLFVQIGAGFLGTIQILVYAGAVMVLFVFIIMLLNLAGDGGRRLRSVPMKALGVVLLGAIFAAVYTAFGSSRVGPSWGQAREGFGSIASVGSSLFRGYVLPFEIAGLLLLAAIIGTIVLARRKT